MGVTQLWLVRHGESTANASAAHAELSGSEIIDSDVRDADVPLSETGQAQAVALGRWLAGLTPDARPTAMWSSSYRRAEQTISIALETAHLDLPVRVDERLRDRELGILDFLTTHGVETRYPGEAERLRRLGKFYYRPPGGESWADIALRVRSFLGDLSGPEPDGTTLVASHDAVVMVFVYVCLGLTEAQLLDFAATNSVTNASVTRLSRPMPGVPWTMDVFAHNDHLAQFGAPTTDHSAAPAAGAANPAHGGNRYP